MDPQLLSRPLYRSFIALFDNYHTATGLSEDMTAQKNAEIDAFLDELSKTMVFNKTLMFLALHGK